MTTIKLAETALTMMRTPTLAALLLATTLAGCVSSQRFAAPRQPQATPTRPRGRPRKSARRASLSRRSPQDRRTR